MAGDSFLNRMGGLVDTTIAMVRHVRDSEQSMERVVSAYRQNIALPDVHVADRLVEFEPLVVAEDGQELTPERRLQLMREARVPPMFDQEGKSNGQDYRTVFDPLIEPERLGETAEGRRQGYRVVQPREIGLSLDIGHHSESDLKPIEGESHAE